MARTRTYLVEGADGQTGEQRSIRIRATSRMNAELRANDMGLLVTRVTDPALSRDHDGPGDLTVADLGKRLAQAPASLFLAIVIFAASWFFPVVAISPIKIGGFQACGVSFEITLHAIDMLRTAKRDSERFPSEVLQYTRATATELPDAWDVLTFTSATWYITAWALNIVFAVVVWLCLMRRGTSVMFPLALGTAIWSTAGMYDPIERGFSTFFSVGYYFWVASFIVLAVVAFGISNRAHRV